MSSNEETQQPPIKTSSSGLPVKMECVAAVTTLHSDPKFRSIAVMEPASIVQARKSSPNKTEKRFIGRETDNAAKPGAFISNPTETIKADFNFREISAKENDDVKISQGPIISPKTSQLEDIVLRPVPPHYPLEKSSRVITGSSASIIFSRISDCCRIMSVQVRFNHDAGTAYLETSDHTEIYLSLWRELGPKHPNGVIVEVQRRKGDAVTFHKYCRNILDAADGEFDATEFHAQEEREKGHCKTTEHILAESKKRHSNVKQAQEPLPDHEKALLALEIASSLLKKDRMDARQLGMESLCLLTDPDRAGIETALIASRVILTDSARGESRENDNDNDSEPEELGCQTREALLSLVQFGRLAEDCDFTDDANSDDEDTCTANRHPKDQEHNNLLHNLALAVLANALDVLKNHGNELAARGTTRALVADTFLSEAEISSRDLLSTLLSVIEAAGRKPHDACLSARCLGSLCEASSDARRRAKDMNAKSIIAAALEVGRQTNVKLEAETEKVLATLQKAEDDEEHD